VVRLVRDLAGIDEGGPRPNDRPGAMARRPRPMMAPATSSTTRRRVLVTGGAGFIGSHLCERLLASGHAVLCVDDLSSGDAANIDHLRERADSGAVDFETMRHDIVAPLEAEVDAIYNLACPASPLAYQRHPVQTTKTAVYGAINMLDLARRRDARIFQASTSEVYGEPAEHCWVIGFA